MKKEVKELTADWERCVFVQDTINEEFIRNITAQILKFRQENDNPITVAIDSPGGAIGLLPTLFGLLRGPDQDGNQIKVITVSVNHAYSAAASLLAMGDYAIAMRHSDILFHDVRYRGLDDVTPAKAANAAVNLKISNNKNALKLAEYVFDRLIWNYIDLKPKLPDIIKAHPDVHKRYAENYAVCLNRPAIDVDIDLSGFLTAIHLHLTRTNETLIDTSIDNLCRWRATTLVAENAQKDGNGINKLIAPSEELFNSLKTILNDSKNTSIEWNNYSTQVGVIHTLLVEHLVRRSPSTNLAFSKLIDVVKEDFELIQSINDPSHFTRAEDLMIHNKNIFLDQNARTAWESGKKEEREKVLAALRPSFQLFWHFSVLLCRELFNGEHILNGREAQVLGIVDEVAGGGPIESRREFRKSKEDSIQLARATEQ